MIEVMEAVAGAIGAERCGVRLSPYNEFLDAQDSVQRAIDKNVWLMKQLDQRVPGLAYIHMVRHYTERLERLVHPYRASLILS
jgi:2,4-dienoyl-CoA reductase-like NADH-dependent reductase (Old Yellow Enzyme family)